MQVVGDYENFVNRARRRNLEQMRVVGDFGIFVDRAKRSNFEEDAGSGGF